MSKPEKLSEAERHFKEYTYRQCMTGSGPAVRIACDFRLDVKNLLAELAAKDAEIARLREALAERAADDEMYYCEWCGKEAEHESSGICATCRAKNPEDR